MAARTETPAAAHSTLQGQEERCSRTTAAGGAMQLHYSGRRRLRIEFTEAAIVWLHALRLQLHHSRAEQGDTVGSATSTRRSTASWNLHPIHEACTRWIARRIHRCPPPVHPHYLLHLSSHYPYPFHPRYLLHLSRAELGEAVRDAAAAGKCTRGEKCNRIHC